jgi:hypothetical protein
MGEKRAVPALIGQIFEPDIPLEDLSAAVSAVVDLGDASVVKPLRAFLLRYRADSSFKDHPEALARAAEGLIRHGEPEDRRLVFRIAADGRTLSALAGSIRRLLEPDVQELGSQSPAVEAREKTEPRSARLTQRQVNSVFYRHIDEIRPCLSEELGRRPDLAQVRLAFVLDGDGSPHHFSFSPDTPELAGCLAPKVARYRFPPFQAGRQLASFAIALKARAGKVAETGKRSELAPHSEERAWWSPLRTGY